MKKILLSLLMLCFMTVAWAEGTGDGSKEHPFTGEWEASEIGPKLEAGQYLAFDCVIKNGGITVMDSRLGALVATRWKNWAPGNFINAPEPGSNYEQYGKDNPLANRKSQSFILTDVSPSAKTSTEFTITGYFNGFYTTPDAKGFVYVESAEQMWIILRGNNNVKANERANIKLTGDIYLTDIAVGTFCSTFYGTLDGDGHTIYGSHDGTRQNKTYLFTYSDGATFRNLNFYNIRVDNRDHHNQAIITSQAKNGCVFENITFDKVSTYTGDGHDNTGAAVGYAIDFCTFTNITIKNSDLTADNKQSGGVVGHAKNCEFKNIKIENCESTARNGKAGGVVGRADNCKFSDVEILGTFVKMSDHTIFVGTECDAGGVAGYAENSQFTNCTVDDQSCMCGDQSTQEDGPANLAGIVGYAENCNVRNCINSALIASGGHYTGGIVGYSENSNIEDCLNTGMVISLYNVFDKVQDFYKKYRTKDKTVMDCVTKTYKGKEYVIRRFIGDTKILHYKKWYGGIVGQINKASVSKCVNFGSMYVTYRESLTPWVNGGIAGTSWGATISDCLSDFDATGSMVFGLCRSFHDEDDKSTIKNCLNMTPYKASDKGFTKDELVTASNNYSVSTEDDVFIVKHAYAADVKTGIICNSLDSNWEQNLATDAYPTPTGNKGVYYTRNITNEYGTICLPFELESNEDITYYRFNNPEPKNVDGNLVLEFEKMDHVEAGVPVLFRTSKRGEFTFRNTGSSFDHSPWDSRGPGVKWFIQGVYYNEEVFTESTTRPSDRVYYISNNEIRNAKKTTIAPYRAWIGGPSINELTAAGVKGIRFAIEDEDGETTALEYVGEDLVPVQNNGKTYSLMGTEVGEGYRGIVIKNGKKMIQKR